MHVRACATRTVHVPMYTMLLRCCDVLLSPFLCHVCSMCCAVVCCAMCDVLCVVCCVLCCCAVVLLCCCAVVLLLCFLSFLLQVIPTLNARRSHVIALSHSHVSCLSWEVSHMKPKNTLIRLRRIVVRRTCMDIIMCHTGVRTGSGHHTHACVCRHQQAV